MIGILNTARANKENIFYTILTVFLLERVRRGWNRIDSRGREHNLDTGVIERRQQNFAFRASCLYAVPLVIPAVKYIYRSVGELAQYVDGLSALSSIWAFAGVVIITEVFLAVVIYNLLGIYVERMNGALGFFRTIGRSVRDGSKLAAQTGGSVANATVRAGRGIRATANAGINALNSLAIRVGRPVSKYARSSFRMSYRRLRAKEAIE